MQSKRQATSTTLKHIPISFDFSFSSSLSLSLPPSSLPHFFISLFSFPSFPSQKQNGDILERAAIDNVVSVLGTYIRGNRPLLIAFMCLSNLYLLDKEPMKAIAVTDNAFAEIAKRSRFWGIPFVQFCSSLWFIKGRSLVAVGEITKAKEAFNNCNIV
jgi:hypothetical protein